MQKVLDKIDTSNEVGLRDRALLGTLAYTFARIGAVVNLKVEDYFQTGKRSMIRFREKGGKETEIPVHHKLEELLDQHLQISGLRNMDGSGFPNFHIITSVENSAPEAEANSVLSAIIAMKIVRAGER